MKSRYLEVLILGLIVSVCASMVVFTFVIQQREIESLNRDLVETRQEVARKTNLLYEANRRSDVVE